MDSITTQSDGQSLNEVCRSHFVCQAQRRLRRLQVLDSFPDYVDDSSFNDWHLALYRFATQKPLLYLHRQTIDQAVAFFAQNPGLTVRALADLQEELSHALMSMLGPGSSWDAEGKLSLDTPAGMAEFDRVWHPEYQRYCEHVFNHLVKVPLSILSALKHKDYLSCGLPIRVQTLQANGLTALVNGYSPCVRNAISHGTTRFGLGAVGYVDANKPPQVLSPSEFAALFDSLVDTCHSIAVALLLFLCRNRLLVESSGLENLPLGLRFMFIDAFASHTNFKLLSMMESETIRARRQLNMVCSIDTTARSAHCLEAISASWHAVKFGGHQYGRFFISLMCGMPVPSSPVIDGDRLQRAITKDEPLAACVPELMRESLLWYDAPALASQHYLWRSRVGVQWQVTLREVVRDWWAAGLIVAWTRYLVIRAQNKSTELVRQVEAYVVLKERGPYSTDVLHAVVRHAVNRLRWRLVRKTGPKGETGLPGRPDCVRVRLHARTRRLRTLMSSSIEDKELLLIAEWIGPRSKAQPFYTRQADAVEGSLRIRYNPGAAIQPR